MTATYLPAWLLGAAHRNRQEKIAELKKQIQRLETSQDLELIEALGGVEFKPGEFCWETLLQWFEHPAQWTGITAIRIGAQWRNENGQNRPTIQLHEGPHYRILPETANLRLFEKVLDMQVHVERVERWLPRHCLPVKAQETITFDDERRIFSRDE